MKSRIAKVGAKAGTTVAAAVCLAVGGWGAGAHAAVGAPWIGYGQANTYNGVKCVQQLVNDLSFSTGYHTVAVDGSFGPDTNGAIRAFQSWEHLPVDGIVGPNTGDALLIATKDGYGCNTYIPSNH
ncbi:peptidoglycan-binding domain-containing protein [Streptomyces sp. NPDC002225]|uniref:peptidoglycan-binding domain-containing protein n=1 Tax=Streptomyces sp. NPDC002225 TaxID=3154413 RepID=UPI0033170B46